MTEQRVRIDAALERLLPLEQGPALTLRRAMRYAALGGGKRVRPTLCMAAFSMYQPDAEPVLPVACALEIVHAFTLIHDDLPCMDDDDLRRGRPTCHKVFGEAQALLAGDGLHNLSYKILAVHAFAAFPAAAALRALEIFSLGVARVCEGQVMDIEAQDAPPDRATLDFIHENKTAALIQASVLCGAVCAGAPEADVRWRHLARYRRAGGDGRSAQVPRRAALCRSPEGRAHQDRS